MADNHAALFGAARRVVAMTNYYALLNKLTAKPGQRDRVVEILLESGRLFDDNQACILYLVSESTDDPNLIWISDLWTSQEEHSAALQAPELRPYIDQAMPLLEGMPEQIEVRPVGGKGLPGLRPRPLCRSAWCVRGRRAAPRPMARGSAPRVAGRWSLARSAAAWRTPLTARPRTARR